MTPSYLSGYVQAILDHWKTCNGIDERKELKLHVNQPCPFEGDIKIEFRFVYKIEEAPYAIHDRNDWGSIQIHDYKPLFTYDSIRWQPTTGMTELWRAVEEMIEEINNIEL